MTGSEGAVAAEVLARAQREMDEGDYAGARRTLGALLATALSDEDRARALGLGVRHAMDCGQDEAARQLLAEHESLVALAFGPLSPEAGAAWELRARLHRLEGRPERAVEAAERALRLLEGEARARCRANLAEAMLELGDLDEAKAVLLAARDEASPALLCRIEALQGRTALARGLPAEAIVHAHATIAQVHTLHGPDAPAFADGLLLLAAAYAAEGDRESALVAADRGVAALARALGPDHPEVGLAAAWMLSLQPPA